MQEFIISFITRNLVITKFLYYLHTAQWFAILHVLEHHRREMLNVFVISQSNTLF